jgi:putative CocE/NonD family hydrolase
MKKHAAFFLFAALAILAGIARIALSAEADARKEYIRSHYAKFEYRIPMRDGARLFTSVYIPYDRSKSYPFLIERTPYSVGPYGPDQYKSALATNEEMEQEGYIFVFQDVRGCFMSEGTFVNMRPHNPLKKTNQDIDESSDTYDTIDWLVKNIPNNNGAAGLWGTSYPGFYSSAGMIDSHPALKAVSPQAPIADWFWDDMHRNGAFNLQMAVMFFSSFGIQRDSLITRWPEGIDFSTHDAYQFFLDLGPLGNVNRDYFEQEIPFWNEVTQHPDYDAFWQARNLLPHLKNIKAAVMVVGGWFDTEDLYGPLKTYQSVEKQNPGIVNTLVMGPWQHGGWNWTKGDSLGSESFGWATSGGFQKECVSRFFGRYLKGNTEGVKQPEAQVFETGANRWRTFDAWPPRQRQLRDLYLCSSHGLAFEPQYASPDSADAFISDPAKPVPHTAEIAKYWSYKYMTEDQRFAGRRPDVLVYTSEVLKENVTFAGPTRVCLYVSTTGSDADWIVKIVDLHPRDDRKEGDLQRLVRADAFRGRFRESFSDPKPFVPGQIARVEYELLDILHTFQKGHRIMIQIQSTWFPFIDRNPQRYVENIFEATAEDFIPATHRVHHSAAYPSHIEVGILPE